MNIRSILMTAAMALLLAPAAVAQNANLANPAALMGWIDTAKMAGYAVGLIERRRSGA